MGLRAPDAGPGRPGLRGGGVAAGSVAVALGRAACIFDGLAIVSMSSGLLTVVPVVAAAVWTRASARLVLVFVVVHAGLAALFPMGIRRPHADARRLAGRGGPLPRSLPRHGPASLEGGVDRRGQSGIGSGARGDRMGDLDRARRGESPSSDRPRCCSARSSSSSPKDLRRPSVAPACRTRPHSRCATRPRPNCSGPRSASAPGDVSTGPGGGWPRGPWRSSRFSPSWRAISSAGRPAAWRVWSVQADN